MYKICIECKSEILNEAEVCSKCCNRIVGIECNECKSICKKNAEICKWCLNSLNKNKKKELNFQSFEINSELLPTLLLSGKFLCQTAIFNNEKIVITTPYSFGLASKTEEVLWNKVTGFQHHAGVVWDSITIETRGQTTNQISFLSKRDAKKVAEILRRVQT